MFRFVKVPKYFSKYIISSCNLDILILIFRLFYGALGVAILKNMLLPNIIKLFALWLFNIQGDNYWSMTLCLGGIKALSWKGSYVLSAVYETIHHSAEMANDRFLETSFKYAGTL